MFLTLRILHIITGVFWAGALFFMVSFLQPALRDAGPDGAKVFAALRARRLFTWVPVMALITIVAGTWLYMLRMGIAGGGWAATLEARLLGAGTLTAILAFTLGLFLMRAPTLTADDISKVAGPMAPGAERDAKMAEALRLRVRATMGGRMVATLLLVTIVLMSIARYM